MKRPIIAIVAILGLGLASCKKEYTCECKRITTNDDGSSTTTPESTYTFKDSRARAETKCNDMETSSDGDVFTDPYTVECQI